MHLKSVLAALAATLLCGAAHAQDPIKIGVLSDMSSLYADIGGPGSVAAAKLAIADFTKDGITVRYFRFSYHTQAPDVIDTLEPFRVTELKRP